MSQGGTMTAHTEEPTATTPVLPMQAAPADDRVSTVVDHVRKHGRQCYWDLTDCRWVCRPE
jgi:hypothetical protein